MKNIARRPIAAKAKVETQAPGQAFLPPLTIADKALQSHGRDNEFREVLYLMVSALGRFHEFREAFARAMGLSSPQFAILMGTAYKQGSDGISIKDLAGNVQLASTHVTTEVGRLCRSGHLQKIQSSSDRRSVLVKLTACGERAVIEVAPFVRAVNDRLFDGVSREDFAVLNAFFHRFVSNSEFAYAEVKRRESRQSQNND